jgi:hypothetical protein
LDAITGAAKMTDIVKRLRQEIAGYTDGPIEAAEATMHEAANVIERLREVRDQLQTINKAKDKEIAILRAEKHLTALKEGK